MAAVVDSSANIRPMGPADVKRVSAIETRCYPFPWSKGVFGDCLRIGYCCRVLECDGAICGYSIMSAAAGEAHILNLCVDLDCRGRGLGGLLLEGALLDAVLQGAGRLFLEVRPSNAPAIALYRGYGFRVIGRRPAYYPAESGREDALVMVRHMDDSER
ncbi:MAG: ribosomal protein S18-alanine N-acetyltransferase [Wenzhouxiangellaceae bacterium]|nr:ribosomal protein S18-alanine N-acetyltransferase [Wenzhouxiangellaceae bacterium]